MMCKVCIDILPGKTKKQRCLHSYSVSNGFTVKLQDGYQAVFRIRIRIRRIQYFFQSSIQIRILVYSQIVQLYIQEGCQSMLRIRIRRTQIRTPITWSLTIVQRMRIRFFNQPRIRIWVRIRSFLKRIRNTDMYLVAVTYYQ